MSTKIQIRNLILEKRQEFHVKDKYVFILIDQDGYLIEGEINNKPTPIIQYSELGLPVICGGGKSMREIQYY